MATRQWHCHLARPKASGRHVRSGTLRSLILSTAGLWDVTPRSARSVSCGEREVARRPRSVCL